MHVCLFAETGLNNMKEVKIGKWKAKVESGSESENELFFLLSYFVK